MVTETYIVPV